MAASSLFLLWRMRLSSSILLASRRPLSSSRLLGCWLCVCWSCMSYCSSCYILSFCWRLVVLSSAFSLRQSCWVWQARSILSLRMGQSMRREWCLARRVSRSYWQAEQQLQLCIIIKVVGSRAPGPAARPRCGLQPVAQPFQHFEQLPLVQAGRRKALLTGQDARELLGVQQTAAFRALALGVGEHQGRQFEELAFGLYLVDFLKEEGDFGPSVEVLLVGLGGNAVREMRLDFYDWKVGDAPLTEEQLPHRLQTVQALKCRQAVLLTLLQ